LRHSQEQGGLSGGPLKPFADRVLQRFHQALPDETTLIGVGGITSGRDAAEKCGLGASLVQFYTGTVYRGPGLISESVKAIAEMNLQ
jgi:dihydroorotate dehydrogenase